MKEIILPGSESDIDKVAIHERICKELTDTYVKKNHDYNDAFSRARKEIPCYTLGKLFDKFERFKNLSKGSNVLVNDETLKDTLMDMANYCILELVEMECEKC